jgi:uncharacterized protein
MKKTISDAFGRYFGASHNDQCAEMFGELATTVKACAAKFVATRGQDYEAIAGFERKADAIVDRIHELLDDSFIMRFDIADMMKLADELDNVIDGMRKVANHISIYKTHLPEMRPDAVAMMEISERMAGSLADLVAMLGQPRLSLDRVREIANVLDAAETEADHALGDAERKLVQQFGVPGANRMDFIAWDKLYHLLEQMTDDANHCGKLILSLARKEA